MWWKSCGTNCVADSTSTLAGVRHDPESGFYRNGLRLGAFFVVREGQALRQCACLSRGKPPFKHRWMKPHRPGKQAAERAAPQSVPLCCSMGSPFGEKQAREPTQKCSEVPVKKAAANSNQLKSIEQIGYETPETKKAHLSVSLNCCSIWCGTRNRTRELLITSGLSRRFSMIHKVMKNR